MAIIPYIVAMCAICAYALLGPIAKKSGMTIPPFAFIAMSSLILFISAGLISFFLEKHQLASSYSKNAWSWMFVFSAINLVAYAGYLWAIARMPVVHYEMMIILAPIVGGIFAFYLLKEPFHVRYIPGLAFMLIGLLIAAKPAFLSKFFS